MVFRLRGAQAGRKGTGFTSVHRGPVCLTLTSTDKRTGWGLSYPDQPASVRSADALILLLLGPRLAVSRAHQHFWGESGGPDSTPGRGVLSERFRERHQKLVCKHATQPFPGASEGPLLGDDDTFWSVAGCKHFQARIRGKQKPDEPGRDRPGPLRGHTSRAPHGFWNTHVANVDNLGKRTI